MDNQVNFLLNFTLFTELWLVLHVNHCMGNTRFSLSTIQ